MLHNRLFFDLLWSLLLYMKMLMFRLLVVRKHPASRLRLFQFTVKMIFHFKGICLKGSGAGEL